MIWLLKEHIKLFNWHKNSKVAWWIRENIVKGLVKLKNYKVWNCKEALSETFIWMDELMKTPMVKKELQKYTTDKDIEGGISDIDDFTMSALTLIFQTLSDALPKFVLSLLLRLSVLTLVTIELFITKICSY